MTCKYIRGWVKGRMMRAFWAEHVARFCSISSWFTRNSVQIIPVNQSVQWHEKGERSSLLPILRIGSGRCCLPPSFLEATELVELLAAWPYCSGHQHLEKYAQLCVMLGWEVKLELVMENQMPSHVCNDITESTRFTWMFDCAPAKELWRDKQ